MKYILILLVAVSAVQATPVSSLGLLDGLGGGLLGGGLLGGLGKTVGHLGQRVGGVIQQVSKAIADPNSGALNQLPGAQAAGALLQQGQKTLNQAQDAAQKAAEQIENKVQK